MSAVDTDTPGKVFPRISRLLGVLLALVAPAASCGHSGAAPQRQATAIVLPKPDSIPDDLTVRQRVVAEHAGRRFAQDTVVQKKGDTLTVIGLAPFGKLWSVVQKGDAVATQKWVPEAMPFPPEAMLADIYRAIGTWLPGPPPTDGERTGEHAGERIRERWAGGRLIERDLVPVAGGGAIRVRASGPLVSGLAEQVELTNERLGYRLQVTSGCAAHCPEPEEP